MVKLVALVTKKHGMSVAAFRAYWTEVHAPLAAQIPGMRGYRINVAGELAPAPYDGSAETWFDSREAMTAGLNSPEGQVAGDDTANFTDSVTSLVADETVVIPGPAP